MKKVLIVGGSAQYSVMFTKLGMLITSSIKDADLVCFTGGADVSPSLYGEEKHPHSHIDRVRDEVDIGIFHAARAANITMVGICRGGQFLHVMNGGKMYQHVDGHATGRPHKAIDSVTGDTHLVTSTHHQMMKYTGSGVLVATASEATRKEFMDGYGVTSDKARINEDVEVIFYPVMKCLCFQPHPEFNWAMEGAESTYLYFKNLMERYINV
jgi:carbamoylphosphate synthase small subunit